MQKKKLTNNGIKALQNKSLKNIKYLNLSNNNITDDGLAYLNELNNLDELVLLNMEKLSDNYFLSLQKHFFFNHMKNFTCDKKKLILENVCVNFNNFNFPNLSLIKIIGKNREVHRTLKGLIKSNKICSKIIELDLSKTSFDDNGMLRLSKNINVFKNIKLINLQGIRLTTYSKKYFEIIEKQKIKIIFDKKNMKQRIQKRKYNIFLGGSTISGKTTLIQSYDKKSFQQTFLTTIGIDYINVSYSKNKDKKFIIYDTSRWNGRFDGMIRNYLNIADGVLLLFDLSSRNDFDQLPVCLNMITDYYELEEFPVLLIGNKADLEKKVDDTEIKQFIQKNKFIRYFEVSSKTMTNVEESINFMMDYIYERDKVFPVGEAIKNTKRKK